MVTSKAAQTSSWAQALARPVFPNIPPAARPYLAALLLFAAVSTLMSAGDAVLLRHGLVWPPVALLLVAATAALWGVRPALLVLLLCVGYGAAAMRLEPLLPPAMLAGPAALVRTALFAGCGAAAIGLVGQAQKMRSRAETQREVVAALQSMSLPAALARATGYDLCGLYKPANAEEEVGGDFYDFYPTGSGHYCVLIGDVMGHGKEAAAATALLRCSVRAFCSLSASPAQIVTQLNALIESQGVAFGTASLLVRLLEPHSGDFCYASAGHEPPLLKRMNGAEEMLTATGPILGVGLDAAYTESLVTLGAGDALLLLTDGVTEARNKHGEFLGSAGAWWMLRAALRMPSARAAVALLDRTLTDYLGADRVHSDHSRCDDIALLLLRRGIGGNDA